MGKAIRSSDSDSRHPIFADSEFDYVFMMILIVTLLGDLVLWAFVMLREDPMFWKDAGGFPLWLRAMVQFGFYPGYMMTGLAMIWLSLRFGQSSMKSAITGATVVFFLNWALWIWIGYLAFHNNFLNLLQGRSSHWHPV